MKKVLIIISLFCILCGCEADKMATQTCSYINDEVQSEVNVTAYHMDDEIAKIIVEMKKVFDSDLVKRVGLEKVKNSVYNSIVSSAGEEAQFEMEYDEKNHEVYVKLIMFTEEMKEEDLKRFNLHVSNSVNNFVSLFESMNYKCGNISK